MINLRYILKNILRGVLNIPYLVACIFPRRKDLWLFGSWFGEKYLDNPKGIYICALKQSEVTPVWLTKNFELYEKMKKDGLPVAYYRSVKGMWLQLRCGVVVFTHGVVQEFSAFLIGSKVFRVQAWHGIPLKKISYDDDRKPNNRMRIKILQTIFPFFSDRCDLVLATGREDCIAFRTAFNVEPENVIITGSARNDMLVRCLNNKGRNYTKTTNHIKNVIYMPTFRGAIGSEFPLLAKSGFRYDDFDKLFDKHNIKFVIKLHPVQKLSSDDAELVSKCKNITIANDSCDIYESLVEYDALITDYSSIFFDFMLTGKPIYMAAFDLDLYLKEDRAMYYDYKDVSPSPIYLNWVDLIEDLLVCKYDYDKYNKILNKFHVYKDSSSSMRCFEVINGQLLGTTGRKIVIDHRA